MFSLLSWQQRMMQKISPRNIILAFLGKVLFWFGLGAWFAEELGEWRRLLLFLGIVGILYYLLNNFLEWKLKREIQYKNHLLGAFSAALLVLAFSVEFAELRSVWLFVGGLLLVVPAIREMAKK